MAIVNMQSKYSYQSVMSKDETVPILAINGIQQTTFRSVVGLKQGCNLRDSKMRVLAETTTFLARQRSR